MIDRLVYLVVLLVLVGALVLLMYEFWRTAL
jgi:hypothetical protein